MSSVEQETTAEWFTLLNYITLVLDLVICRFPLDLSSFLLILPNELIFQGTLSQYLSFSYESTAHFVIHLHAISYHLLPTSEENPIFNSCWSLLIFSTKFNIYITKTERQKKSAFSYLYY